MTHSTSSSQTISHRQSAAEPATHTPRGSLAALSVGALGIVFGDIGTSPLYAMDQIFRVGIERTPENLLGGVSLVVWTLTLIVAIKYAILVLRAQNDGEGGVFALYALLHDKKRWGTQYLLWGLMLGAGLLFGDGMITPAISVLSAVEGLAVATPALGNTVIPITIGLLTVLFSIQSKGTSGIGKIFGPVLGVWFAAISLLGAWQIALHPDILAAFNPIYGITFLGRMGFFNSLLILGALMLVVTGGEAMYADVGHFGDKPIRLSWFAIVFPALLLNYLGQGAYLLGGEPVVGDNLFYSLVPTPLLYPMVLLATVSTIIASQALISGGFSLTSQAIRLGLFPRIAVEHTHHAHSGQIYIPFINWALYAGCVLLVLAFGSSSALAAAYGLAVSGVMVITSLAMFPIARHHWNWDTTLTGFVWGCLTAVNGSFLIASSIKFLEGGFVPLSVGVAVFLVMTTWKWGRKATFAAYSAKHRMTMAELVALHRSCDFVMDRTALLMTPRPLHHGTDRTPALLQMLWERNGVLPQNLIFVEIIHRIVPYIKDNRFVVIVFDRDRERGRSIVSVEMSFGFMEEPNVELLLEDMARHKEIDLPADPRQWIVHVSHENILPSRKMKFLASLRFRLFLFLRGVSRHAYHYYGLGDQVQLSAEIIPVRVK